MVIRHKRPTQTNKPPLEGPRRVTVLQIDKKLRFIYRRPTGLVGIFVKVECRAVRSCFPHLLRQDVCIKQLGRLGRAGEKKELGKKKISGRPVIIIQFCPAQTPGTLGFALRTQTPRNATKATSLAPNGRLAWRDGMHSSADLVQSLAHSPYGFMPLSETCVSGKLLGRQKHLGLVVAGLGKVANPQTSHVSTMVFATCIYHNGEATRRTGRRHSRQWQRC